MRTNASFDKKRTPLETLIMTILWDELSANVKQFSMERSL